MYVSMYVRTYNFIYVHRTVCAYDYLFVFGCTQTDSQSDGHSFGTNGKDFLFFFLLIRPANKLSRRPKESSSSSKSLLSGSKQIHQHQVTPAIGQCMSKRSSCIWAPQLTSPTHHVDSV